MLAGEQGEAEEGGGGGEGDTQQGFTISFVCNCTVMIIIVSNDYLQLSQFIANNSVQSYLLVSMITMNLVE